MAELSEKVHDVHYSTRILSAELSYNDLILNKNTPTGKELAFVRLKTTGEKTNSPREDIQIPSSSNWQPTSTACPTPSIPRFDSVPALRRHI
jgi:hypothetical protein